MNSLRNVDCRKHDCICILEEIFVESLLRLKYNSVQERKSYNGVSVDSVTHVLQQKKKSSALVKNRGIKGWVVTKSQRCWVSSLQSTMGQTVLKRLSLVISVSVRETEAIIWCGQFIIPHFLSSLCGGNHGNNLACQCPWDVVSYRSNWPVTEMFISDLCASFCFFLSFLNTAYYVKLSLYAQGLYSEPSLQTKTDASLIPQSYISQPVAQKSIGVHHP